VKKLPCANPVALTIKVRAAANTNRVNLIETLLAEIEHRSGPLNLSVRLREINANLAGNERWRTDFRDDPANRSDMKVRRGAD
jgi:hypothetical protein